MKPLYLAVLTADLWFCTQGSLWIRLRRSNAVLGVEPVSSVEKAKAIISVLFSQPLLLFFFCYHEISAPGNELQEIGKANKMIASTFFLNIHS